MSAFNVIEQNSIFEIKFPGALSCITVSSPSYNLPYTAHIQWYYIILYVLSINHSLKSNVYILCKTVSVHLCCPSALGLSSFSEAPINKQLQSLHTTRQRSSNLNISTSLCTTLLEWPDYTFTENSSDSVRSSSYTVSQQGSAQDAECLCSRAVVYVVFWLLTP